MQKEGNVEYRKDIEAYILENKIVHIHDIYDRFSSGANNERLELELQVLIDKSRRAYKNQKGIEKSYDVVYFIRKEEYIVCHTHADEL